MHAPRYGLICVYYSVLFWLVHNNSYAEHFLAFRGHKQAPFKCNN